MLSIGDGDTIRVLEDGTRITVRLACIDAPEMAQAPHGEQARRYLQSRLRIGSNVRLIPQTIDRYSRTVAEVIGTVNLNLAMVEDGQAFAYRKYLGQCNTSMPKHGPVGTALGCGRCLAGSPGPGTFAAAEHRLNPAVILDPFWWSPVSQVQR